MKAQLLLLPVLGLTSCTVHPFAYNPQTGEMTSLGMSVLTKSTSEQAVAYTPGGLPMSYAIAGKDETVIGKYYFLEKGISSIAGNALSAYRTAQSTERILSGHSVERLGIRATRDVRLAEIAIPEVPVVPTIPVP